MNEVQETSKTSTVNRVFMGILGLCVAVVLLIVFMCIIAGIVWVCACYVGIMADVIEDAFRTGRDLF